MNVWIVNHYGGPPNSGRFERPVYTARAFAARGHSCTVFSAGFHHLLNAPEVLTEPRITRHDGVTYVELPCRSYGSNGALRVLNMLDSSRALWRFAKDMPGAVRAPDVLIASSPPPFLFGAAEKIRRRLGCRVVFEMRDLWPESLVQLAGVSEWHPFVLWLRHAARRAYRGADAVVSLLPRIDRYFAETGISPQRLEVITNGIDAGVFGARTTCEIPQRHREALQEMRTAGKRIVIYTGAMGPPNALDQLLELRPAGERVYRLVLVGDGMSRPYLEAEAKRRGLDFIHFLPKVEKRQVPGLLALADAAVILWNDTPLYRYGVSPNKVSEYLLAEKPVIWVGDTGSNPIADSGAGWSVPANDPVALGAALDEMAALDGAALTALGQLGRRHVLEHFNWETLGGQYELLARELVDEGVR